MSGCPFHIGPFSSPALWCDKEENGDTPVRILRRVEEREEGRELGVGQLWRPLFQVTCPVDVHEIFLAVDARCFSFFFYFMCVVVCLHLCLCIMSGEGAGSAGARVTDCSELPRGC